MHRFQSLGTLMTTRGSIILAIPRLSLRSKFFNLVSIQVDMHLRVLNLQSPLPLADLLMLKKTPRLASMLKKCLSDQSQGCLGIMSIHA